MDTQEYLGFIAILDQARSSIKTVSDDHPDVASSLKQVIADLERAIQAYRAKVNAAQS